MNKVLLLLPAILCGVSGVAASAAPNVATWPPTQCGREPVAPQVDDTTVERYNSSVDRVTLYERQARAFNTCVAKAANVEQTAISDDARNRIDAIQSVSIGLQRRIAANFNALSAALRRGPTRSRQIP